MGARRRAPLSHHYSFYFTNNFFARAALAKSSTVTSRQLCCAIRGESPSQEQTTFSGSSRWGIVYFHAVATKEFESPLFRRPSHQDQSRKMRAVVARRCDTDLRTKTHLDPQDHFPNDVESDPPLAIPIKPNQRLL